MPPVEPQVLLENPYWMVTAYPAETPPGRAPAAVVSFAGVRWRHGPEAMVEEFKESLSSYPVHRIFVLDRKRSYWNNDGIAAVWAAINGYMTANGIGRAGLIGMSAGASGAIIASRHIDNVDRILCFVPQYSLASPVVWAFEPRRIRQWWRSGRIRHYRYTRIGIERRRAVLVYGDQWDFIHRKLFRLNGFPVAELPGYDHGAAGQMRELKMLRPLMKRFCDFDSDWDGPAVVRDLMAVAAEMPKPQPTVGPFARGLKDVKFDPKSFRDG